MKRHTAKLMGLYLLAATAGACAADAGIDTEPDPLVEDDPVTPTTTSDECEINGWYGDGVCDLQCPNPDPDCSGGQGQQPPPGGDVCETNGWYGDGYCDLECAFPDPDCSGGQDGQGGQQGDVCETNGWYGDGYCDLECAFPDPDCQQEGGF